MMRWLSLITLVLLSGCQVAFPNTNPSYPSWFAAREAAVTAQAKQAGAQRILTKPETWLERPLFGQTVAVVTYQALVAGTPTEVTSLVYVMGRDNQWFPTGGVTQHRSTAGTQPSVEYIAGTITGDAADYGPAGGLVRDPAVHKMVVTFADGMTIETEVENGAYLLGRQGAGVATKVEAVGTDGRVLHTLLDSQGASDHQ